ncbi:hypothetical protein [Cryptosporangium aurantiacum]|uniref:Uncharacterized protein n=1 Tax=Cryptosporangium aurantiacum TaxID=134849 RepID=A0A1M7Q9G3_9ACTN|nr:hypothetical protein [Cryptosporangium aurantiacum]SHN27301.1 hypothetical protein SAMN05443668_104355 [Cryptosporangium aurantiacum]
MNSPLSGAASDALDRALDQLRIRLLATAATRLQPAENDRPIEPSNRRCHSTGAPRRKSTNNNAA